jgi:hypothetical protein
MYSYFARIGHPNVGWSIGSSYSFQSGHLLSIYFFQNFSLYTACADCLIHNNYYNNYDNNSYFNYNKYVGVFLRDKIYY